MFKLIIIVSLVNLIHCEIPIVINTWAFKQAAEQAWYAVDSYDKTAVETLVIGCSTCEVLQCDTTVGYGGSPDENGETTLDAMIFDGLKMDVGAVGGLRRIKPASSVAYHVLKHTEHSILVGDLATEFAKKFNYNEESLSTNISLNMWRDWKKNSCQPNFWKNVEPDPKTSCGPYQPEFTNDINSDFIGFNTNNHDTIGMVVIDKDGNIAAGTSSNGAKFKIPGRIGDAPIPGAGAYADNDAGAAVATGDGDIMMRFLPSFLAVEEMRRGATPTKAAQTAISRIASKYPDFFGALIVVDKKGRYGAACNGMSTFPYSIATENRGVIIEQINCD